MRRQMNAVGDEARRQPVFRQLGEKRIVELRQNLRQSIAEMGRQTCPSFGGGGHRRKARSRMADGDNAPSCRHGADEDFAIFKFGGDSNSRMGRTSSRVSRSMRDASGVLVAGRMASRITVAGIEERPFEVIARHHQRPEPALRDGPVQGAGNGLRAHRPKR